MRRSPASALFGDIRGGERATERSGDRASGGKRCRNHVLIHRADLPPNQPAIDRDDRSGHIIGQVGSKELDNLGAILDRPEPPKGDQLGPIAVTLDAAWNDRRHDPSGRDDTGSNGPHQVQAVWPNRKLPLPNWASIISRALIWLSARTSTHCWFRSPA